MPTTVLHCPKCSAITRLPEGATEATCESCGGKVQLGPGVTALPSGEAGASPLRQAIVAGSLVLVTLAFVGLAVLRRPKPSTLDAPPPPPTPPYVPLHETTVAPTPAGEVAWEPSARAPVILQANGDGVEDFFGFFRVWDGNSAWVAYAGEFDGATLQPVWRTEPIDPQILKRSGVVPMAVVVGNRLAVSDTSSTLRVFALATGDKIVTIDAGGAVAELCGSPEAVEKAPKAWIRVISGVDSLVDLTTGIGTPTPRPKWCPGSSLGGDPVVAVGTKVQPSVPRRPSTRPASEALRPQREALAEAARKQAALLEPCVEGFTNGLLARASCRSPADAPPLETPDLFQPRYELVSGDLAVFLGTKGSEPFAQASRGASGGRWVHPLVTDGTKAKPGAPAVADLAFGRLYVVYEKVFFDARLAAVDASSGQTLWDVPLAGSLLGSDGSGRGPARSLVTTAARVYVVRTGGSLDVFEASSGKLLGTIGKT